MQLIKLTPEQKKEHKHWVNHFEKKYSFKFLNPTYDEVPFVSQFFLKDPDISKRISRLEYYLLGSYPIDMGTNVHQEMHKLRYSFSQEEYEWHQRHDKLGLNCWGTQAGIGIIVLNLLLKRNDLHVESFPIEDGYSFADRYSFMPFNGKLNLCISVDKKLYNILEKLYINYSK